MSRCPGDAPVLTPPRFWLEYRVLVRAGGYGTVNLATANLSGNGFLSGAGFAVDAVERRPGDAPVMTGDEA